MNSSKIQLSDHFNYVKLIKFTLPSIIMMIFTSIYGVVDGFFVSNYVGNTPFAALNLIMPYAMAFAAIGFMFGAGGSALTAVKLGEGQKEKANEIFSLIIYLVIILGIAFWALAYYTVPSVSKLLGASTEMLPYCVSYARVLSIGLPFFMVQNCFQTFLIAAEKPQMGLWVTLAAGITNMILDWLFMGIFGWGIRSAAAATVIGQIVGSVIPLIYFSLPNDSLLKLGKTHFYGKVVLKSMTNGSSEFLSNISMSVVNMLYNYQLMKLAGENGVSAFGIIMYTNFIFVGVYFGYAIGAGPITGYNLGATNYDELKNVFNKSLKIILYAGIIMTVIAVASARLLAAIFASKSPELLEITTNGIRIYSVSFLFMGFNIFSSAFFTSMNNGLVSAIISFLRTLVFQLLSVLLLPLLFGINGVWASVDVAELLSIFVTIICFIKYKKVYHYA